jgi:drug/metabolite transporter (DMT)-like permease
VAAGIYSLSGLPTLFVSGVVLTCGGLVVLPWTRRWRTTPKAYVAGTLSMLAYHLLYFHALQVGEPISVSLIHYLWPTLIPLVAGGTEYGYQWRGRTIALGIGGATFACMSTNHLPAVNIDTTHARALASSITPYAFALLSAVIGAEYSSNRSPARVELRQAPGVYFLSAGLACLAAYFSRNSFPHLTFSHRFTLLYLGAGPMGVAFLLWIHGVKRAATRKITLLGYATPALSTVFLFIGIGKPVSIWLPVGVAMVTASIALVRLQRRQRSQRSNHFKFDSWNRTLGHADSARPFSPPSELDARTINSSVTWK